MERIDRLQLTMIGITFVLDATLISIPTQVLNDAQQDAWMSYLLAMAVCLLPLYFLAQASGRFPNQDLFQAAISRFPVVGRLLSLLLIAGFLFILCRDLRMLSDFINVALLQKTPLYAIGILAVFTLIVMARMGIENIARLNGLVLPVLLFAILIIGACFLHEIEFRNFTPLLEFGYQPALKGALFAFPYLGEAMVLPFLNSGGTFRFKQGFWGLMIGTFALFFLLFFTIAVLGTEMASRLVYPTYELVRQIRVTDFMDRFDVLLLFIWMPCMIVKLSLSLYLVSHGLKRVMPKFSAKQLAPLVGIAALAGSLAIFRNPIDLLHFNRIWPMYASVFEFGIPVFLFLFLRPKRSRAKKGDSV